MMTQQILALVAAGLAAGLHVVFFVLESVLFRTSRGRRLFGVRSEHDSPPLRLFAVNQGVYNLGLAVVVILGIVVLVGEPSSIAGLTLIIAGCSVMVLAGVALAWTAPRMLLAALVQGIPPLIAIGLLLVG
jgi:putative membrane protein